MATISPAVCSLGGGGITTSSRQKDKSASRTTAAGETNGMARVCCVAGAICSAVSPTAITAISVVSGQIISLAATIDSGASVSTFTAGRREKGYVCTAIACGYLYPIPITQGININRLVTIYYNIGYNCSSLIRVCFLFSLAKSPFYVLTLDVVLAST